jgi:ABC-type transport system substrate-binding protein
MKSKFSQKVAGVLSAVFSRLTVAIGALVSFAKRTRLGIRSMSKSERLSLVGLIVIFVVLAVIKGRDIYLNRTVAVPKMGGVYREIDLGQLDYLNPILAKSDTERSISRLIYSGLVKVDGAGNVVPDLAESWEIAPDGLIYTFHLAKNVYFDNGAGFEAEDVVATIARIKDAQTKSPYQQVWADIDVDATSPDIVTMTLPYPYGPFLYNCTQGIVDSSEASGSLVGNINGTGPYRIDKISTDKNGKIEKIELSLNDSNYLNPVLIGKVEFTLTKDSKDLTGGLDRYAAAAGGAMDHGDFSDLSFSVNRYVALIPNIRRELMADQNNRDIIFKDGSFTEKTKLSLLVQDVDSQIEIAAKLADELGTKNIDLEVVKLPGPEYLERRAARDYDLLLTGFDFGYDRDPYTYWHSSQMDKENYAGYSEKSSDITLEDARMMQDAGERNKRYDQFFDTIKGVSLVRFFDPIQYQFYISDGVKGVEPIIASKPEDRFNTISSWYLKEGRVKK